MWASAPTGYCENSRLLIGRTEASAPTSFLGTSGVFVGGDAHIAPFDINKFAKNFLKNGAIRWADVGIGPYA